MTCLFCLKINKIIIIIRYIHQRQFFCGSVEITQDRNCFCGYKKSWPLLPPSGRFCLQLSAATCVILLLLQYAKNLFAASRRQEIHFVFYWFCMTPKCDCTCCFYTVSIYERVCSACACACRGPFQVTWPVFPFCPCISTVCHAVAWSLSRVGVWWMASPWRRDIEM